MWLDRAADCWLCGYQPGQRIQVEADQGGRAEAPDWRGAHQVTQKGNGSMEAYLRYVIIPSDPDATVQLRPYVDFRKKKKEEPK